MADKFLFHHWLEVLETSQLGPPTLLTYKIQDSMGLMDAWWQRGGAFRLKVLDGLGTMSMTGTILGGPGVRVATPESLRARLDAIARRDVDKLLGGVESEGSSGTMPEANKPKE